MPALDAPLDSMSPGPEGEAAVPLGPAFAGLLVRPMAARLEAWLAEGKLDEDMLERVLTSNARAWLDHPPAERAWVDAEDFGSLVALVMEQRGDDTGLAEWAGEIAGGLAEHPVLISLFASAERLPDGPGFLLGQASDLFFRAAEWRYEGGRDHFRVTLAGLADLGSAIAVFSGACLAALVEQASPRIDARFEGVDSDRLAVFGERAGADLSPEGESRLHRAALVP